MWISVAQDLLVSALLGMQSWHGQGKDKLPFWMSSCRVCRGQGKGQGLCLKSLLCPAGQRWSTACAYLHPALNRPNLTAEARTFVNRVLFEGTRAVGVEYVKNGQSHRVSQVPPGLGSSDGRKGVDSSHVFVSTSTVMRSEQLVAMA